MRRNTRVIIEDIEFYRNICIRFFREIYSLKELRRNFRNFKDIYFHYSILTQILKYNDTAKKSKMKIR